VVYFFVLTNAFLHFPSYIGNYGERHIERKERLQELQSNGYLNARDLVQDVARGYTAIYSGESGRLTLYKNEGKKGLSLFVELMPAASGDFYDVKTGMVTRGAYFNNKNPRRVRVTKATLLLMYAMEFIERRNVLRLFTYAPCRGAVPRLPLWEKPKAVNYLV